MDNSLSASENNLISKCSDSNVTPPNFASSRNKRRRMEDDLDTYKEEMKVIVESMLEKQGKELKKITQAVLDIKQTNTNIEKTMDFMTAQNEDLKRKLESLEIQAKKDKEYITLLEDKIEDMQREGRKSNIVMKNVPKQPNETKEDLISMTLSLGKNINCEISKSEIKDIYRVKNRKQDNTNTPIVVEFTSTILKADIIKMCKSYNIKRKEKLRAKHLGFKNNEETPIFVSEQLTAKGARLYFLARDLAKSKGYKYCWTAYGKVYMKQQDGSQTHIIQNEAQIQHLTNKI